MRKDFSILIMALVSEIDDLTTAIRAEESVL